MLSKWLDQDCDATYGKLARVLLAVGEAACANQLAMDMVGDVVICCILFTEHIVTGSELNNTDSMW